MGVDDRDIDHRFGLHTDESDRLLARWLENRSRIAESPSGLRAIAWNSDTKRLLKASIAHWFRSPQSSESEIGWVIAGWREVLKDTGVLVTKFEWFGLVEGLLKYQGQVLLPQYDRIAQAFFGHQISSGEWMEPVAIVHTHPTSSNGQELRFSPSDRHFITDAIGGGIGPGFYLGLAAQEGEHINIKFATANGGGDVIETLLAL